MPQFNREPAAFNRVTLRLPKGLKCFWETAVRDQKGFCGHDSRSFGFAQDDRTIGDSDLHPSGVP